MNPKSGKSPNPVPPAEPVAAEDADVADPGEVAEAKAKQKEAGKGKYGATPVKPHSPPQNEEEEETKTAWIEVEMVDEEDQPVAGVKYEVTLPDDTVARGTLDQNGLPASRASSRARARSHFPIWTRMPGRRPDAGSRLQPSRRRGGLYRPWCCGRESVHSRETLLFPPSCGVHGSTEDGHRV